MSETEKILQDFGLGKNEVQIYLTLLKLGSASASEISQKTKIHRINIYDLLEKLQQRGLVSYVIMGKRKHYESVDPKKILEIEEERRNKIKSIIPELSSQRSLTQMPQEATIFKNKKGIRNILEDITRSKTEVLLFASGWGFKENFPEYYDIWHERLKLNKVKIKTLISNKLKDIEIPESLQYKFLPSEFIFPSTTVVYEDKTFIIMWSAQPIGILIRGKEISNSYKQFFELLWKTAKK